MTDLRKQARGEPCMVRSPVCNFDIATTVLAHYRMNGISGAGMKSPDLMGSWTCSACHDLIDARVHVEGLDRDAVRLLHLQGVMRTQAELIKRSIVKW